MISNLYVIVIAGLALVWAALSWRQWTLGKKNDASGFKLIAKHPLTANAAVVVFELEGRRFGLVESTKQCQLIKLDEHSSHALVNPQPQPQLRVAAELC